ncbi:MAG: toll/interleukin-1 receptor domain-containing protein [Ruminococcaceae bacterium]|nr:toll/interleukin-1 receptor domain-containing protein [Oscillospiraceae bacterium]
MSQTYTTYEGNEPYIFVSYSHKDTELVMPVICGLQEYGFRAWYDVGTELGYEWPEYIANHILSAHCMLFFVTQNAADSQYCRQEVTYATACRKPIIRIQLGEKVQLSPGMQMMLNNLQASLTYKPDNCDALVEELSAARMLQPCLADDRPENTPSVSDDTILQFKLGECCYFGRGTAQDCYQAADYFRKAAEAGYAPAQVRLGSCYYFGKGVLRNIETALEWYQKAAAQNNAAAQFRIGECYFLGIGYAKDYNRAFMWFRKAAAQGYAKAEEYLKKYYYSGRIIRGEMH